MGNKVAYVLRLWKYSKRVGETSSHLLCILRGYLLCEAGINCQMQRRSERRSRLRLIVCIRSPSDNRLLFFGKASAGISLGLCLDHWQMFLWNAKKKWVHTLLLTPSNRVINGLHYLHLSFLLLASVCHILMTPIHKYTISSHAHTHTHDLPDRCEVEDCCSWEGIGLPRHLQADIISTECWDTLSFRTSITVLQVLTRWLLSALSLNYRSIIGLICQMDLSQPSKA